MTTVENKNKKLISLKYQKIFAWFEANCHHQKNKGSSFICFLQWTWWTALWFSKFCHVDGLGRAWRPLFLCSSFLGSSRSCFGEPGWATQHKYIHELPNSLWVFSWPCMTGEEWGLPMAAAARQGLWPPAIWGCLVSTWDLVCKMLSLRADYLSPADSLLNKETEKSPKCQSYKWCIHS